MANQILHRRDTAANWTAANPVLGAGEIGVESDTNTFKMGDGTTAWASLDYFSGGGGSEIDAVATYTVGAGGDFATVAALSEYFLAQRHATAWEVSGNGRQRAGFITVDLQGLNHSLGGDYISFEWFGSWLVFTNGAIGNGTLVFTNTNVRFANGFAAGYAGNTLGLQANGAFLFDSNDDTNSFGNLSNLYITRGSYLQIWNAYTNPVVAADFTADTGSVIYVACNTFNCRSIYSYDDSHVYISPSTSPEFSSSGTAMNAARRSSIQIDNQPVTAATGRFFASLGSSLIFDAPSGTNLFGNASGTSVIQMGSTVKSKTDLTVSHAFTVNSASTVEVVGTATVSGVKTVADSSALIDSTNSVELHPGLPTSDPSISNALWSSSGVLMLSGGTPPSSYTDADVDTHLNTSTATTGEVLSWTGSDYDWIAAGGGGGLSWETTTVFGGDTVNYAPATTWLGIQDVDNGYVLGSKTDNASFSATIRLFGGTQKSYPYHGGLVHYAAAQTVVYGRNAAGLAIDGGKSAGLNSSGEFAYHGDALTTPKFKVNTQGEVTFNNAFTFPNSDGTANQVLTTDGAGTVTWATAAALTSADPLNLTAAIGSVSGRVNTFEFDGNLTDDQSAETWTFNGTASYANDRNSVASSALTLGSGEYLSKSTPLVGPNDTAWFVGFWFKSDGTAFPSNGSLFGTLYTTNLLHIGTTLTNSTTASLSLTDYTSGWTRVVASTQPTWTDWNHYALQRNGNVLQLFLNGALVATGSAAGDTYPDAWYLGYYSGTMQGDYDQLYIHDEAIITDTSSPFNTDNPGGGDVKVGEIDVTGNTTDSTMVFKQYESGVLTSYNLADLAGGGSLWTDNTTYYNAAVDGIVVGDAGAPNYVNSNFPGITIYGNTGASVNFLNSSGTLQGRVFSNQNNIQVRPGSGNKIFLEDTNGQDVLTTDGATGKVTFGAASPYTFPAARGTADQVLTTDGSGTVTWETPAAYISGGNILMPNLPTSDPAVANALWNDSGTLKVSAG